MCHFLSADILEYVYMYAYSLWYEYQYTGITRMFLSCLCMILLWVFLWNKQSKMECSDNF